MEIASDNTLAPDVVVSKALKTSSELLARNVLIGLFVKSICCFSLKGKPLSTSWLPKRKVAMTDLFECRKALSKANVLLVLPYVWCLDLCLVHDYLPRRARQEQNLVGLSSSALSMSLLSPRIVW
jgi:hypothetical protein